MPGYARPVPIRKKRTKLATVSKDVGTLQSRAVKRAARLGLKPKQGRYSRAEAKALRKKLSYMREQGEPEPGKATTDTLTQKKRRGYGGAIAPS